MKIFKGNKKSQNDDYEYMDDYDYMNDYDNYGNYDNGSYNNDNNSYNNDYNYDYNNYTNSPNDYNNQNNYNNYNDYNGNGNNSNNTKRSNRNKNKNNPQDYYEKEEKIKEKKRNYFISKTRRKVKRKNLEDYSYSTGYDGERIYYNENGEEVVLTKDINYKTMLSLFLAGLYFVFLVLGFVGTTFTNGYKPQIINSKIRGQRITYNKVLKEIDFLEELDDFKGTEELQEIYKTGNFQSRIPPLKKSLKEVNNKIEDMKSSSYKVKENDYINVEMIDMTKDLMQSEQKTLTMAIRFYESMSGYSSTSATLESAQNELLNQQQVYKNKLANYKLRLEQIRSYDLKLEG